MTGKHEKTPSKMDRHPIIRFCCKYVWHMLFELPVGLAAILVAERYILPKIMNHDNPIHVAIQPPYWF